MIPTQVNLDSIKLFSNNSLGDLNESPQTFQPYSSLVREFCSDLANELVRLEPIERTQDIVSLAFWLQKMSVEPAPFRNDESLIRRAKGTIFHIAPSNVPLNFAYSLIAGLITGNRNIVRLPSRDFLEVSRVIAKINNLLDLKKYDSLRTLIFLLRYERNEEVNQFLSNFADVRVIWGGNNTISEVRRALLKPRAFDITFADRYSFCAINASEYLKSKKFNDIARAFYNDVYLFDQNACTAPHLIIWVGEKNEIELAQTSFWGSLDEVVAAKYSYQGISSIDKLTVAQS